MEKEKRRAKMWADMFSGCCFMLSRFRRFEILRLEISRNNFASSSFFFIVKANFVGITKEQQCYEVGSYR